jgi:hypothetical protein
MLAVLYVFLISGGPRQLARFASLYQALSALSASVCFSQNVFSVFTAITRTTQFILFPHWERVYLGGGGKRDANRFSYPLLF